MTTTQEDRSPHHSALRLTQQHRTTLLNRLPVGSLVLVAAGHVSVRNRDVMYPFRPASDFSYLCDLDEPEAVLLLRKTEDTQGQPQHHTCVFLQPKDPEKEVWEGVRLGVDMAPAVLGLDEAASIEGWTDQLGDWLTGIEQVWVSFSELADWARLLSPWIQQKKAKNRQGYTVPVALKDLDAPLHAMRWVKSAEEIQCLRQAAQVSVQGHLAAMKAVAAQRFEYQVQADVEAAFKRHGAQREAFATIVASGANACVLH